MGERPVASHIVRKRMSSEERRWISLGKEKRSIESNLISTKFWAMKLLRLLLLFCTLSPLAGKA